MQQWTTWVRSPTGAIFQVYCQAPSAGQAQMIFEGQYGKPNVLHLPSQS